MSFMIHWTFLRGSWWQIRVRSVICVSVAKKLEFFDFPGLSWYRLESANISRTLCRDRFKSTEQLTVGIVATVVIGD